MTTPSLESLLAQFAALFPASSPLLLKPSADAFAPHAQRFLGGHVARWFAAVDGQQDQTPFADAHWLCGLEEAVDVMRIADELRVQPDGYWVQPHWLAITTDGAGQHLMIDDHDGRVLAVAHDDDAVGVVAPSVDAWLEQLLEGHARGAVVWDAVFGFIEVVELDRIREAQRVQAERRKVTPLPTRHKLGLAASVALGLLLVGAFIWFLESRR